MTEKYDPDFAHDQAVELAMLEEVTEEAKNTPEWQEGWDRWELGRMLKDYGKEWRGFLDVLGDPETLKELHETDRA